MPTISNSSAAASRGFFASLRARFFQFYRKKKVIRLDAITVEDRIQKPQAFYILQRSNLNFDELNKTESFIPKVEKSIEKEAF